MDRKECGCRGVQDTGNPVLDSLVNVWCAVGASWNAEAVSAVHAHLLEMASQEPGGLISRTGPPGAWSPASRV